MRLLPAIALLVGCGPATFEVPFTADHAGVPFACGAQLDGVGTSAVAATALDLRFYVSEVTLVSAGGDAVPAALVPGPFQSEDVAMIDFDDGTAGCDTESPKTHTTLALEAPKGEYAGIAFTVGVPAALNHLDQADLAPPLRDVGMWWGWRYGFKHLRVDLDSPAWGDWPLHLGDDLCEGDEETGYDCAHDNRPRVALDGVDLAKGVRVDVAALFAGTDLNADVDGVIDFGHGCQSWPEDPECVPLFDALGLVFGEGRAGDPQVVFRAN